jgi:hypothetical protein
MLLARELFAKGDPAFVSELASCSDGRAMRRLALKWYADKRAFARRVLFDFADRAIDAGHARVVVKTLFKAALAAEDDELVLHFMVAFDRFTPRQLEEQRGEIVRVPLKREGHDAFSLFTRAYLARRAYRYFRDIGGVDSKRYARRMLQALPLYDDAHIPEPPRLLDCWSLCHILYGTSKHLASSSRRVNLRDGHALADLQPAPAFAKAWRGPRAFRGLVEVVRTGKSWFVRAWALDFIERAHTKRFTTVDSVLVRLLLASPHEEAQRLAALLIDHATGWAELALADWLELLAIDSPIAAPRIVALVEQHMRPDALDFAALVALAKSRLAPVALLGLRWAMERGLADEEALALAATLTGAEVEAVRSGAVAWLAPLLEEKKRSLVVRELVDSRFAPVRRRALELADHDTYRKEAMLHVAMAESPYGDVQDAFSKHLGDWQASLPEGSARQLWATLLMATRSGGRAKQRALRELTARLCERADDRAALLPLLAVLLRSVREPERRSALAALGRAAFTSPELRDEIARAIPELAFEEVGA